VIEGVCHPAWRALMLLFDSLMLFYLIDRIFCGNYLSGVACWQLKPPTNTRWSVTEGKQSTRGEGRGRAGEGRGGAWAY
jgi:hypothetical protein